MSHSPFIAITIHHVAPEHEDEFLAFMRKVLDATAGAPGLLEFRACRDADGRYLAGYSRWETEHAFRQALPTIRSLAPLRQPEWSTQPDEAIRLIAV